jgi:hypothetical protein
MGAPAGSLSPRATKIDRPPKVWVRNSAWPLVARTFARLGGRPVRRATNPRGRFLLPEADSKGLGATPRGDAHLGTPTVDRLNVPGMAQPSLYSEFSSKHNTEFRRVRRWVKWIFSDISSQGVNTIVLGNFGIENRGGRTILARYDFAHYSLFISARGKWRRCRSLLLLDIDMGLRGSPTL